MKKTTLAIHLFLYAVLVQGCSAIPNGTVMDITSAARVVTDNAPVVKEFQAWMGQEQSRIASIQEISSRAEKKSSRAEELAKGNDMRSMSNGTRIASIESSIESIIAIQQGQSASIGKLVDKFDGMIWWLVGILVTVICSLCTGLGVLVMNIIQMRFGHASST
jgi:Flp pilus assembly protein TadB